MFSGHIQLKSLSFLQPGYCLYWFENSREMSDSMFIEKYVILEENEQCVDQKKIQVVMK